MYRDCVSQALTVDRVRTFLPYTTRVLYTSLIQKGDMMIAHDNDGNMNNRRVAVAARSIAEIVEVLLTSLLDEGMSVVEARSLLYYLRSEIDITTVLCIMKHQMDQPEKFVAIDKVANQLRCLDENCPHIKECANHRTAGDYRYTDGLSPILKQTDIDNIWKCAQKPIPTGCGALRADGTYVNPGEL